MQYLDDLLTWLQDTCGIFFNDAQRITRCIVSVTSRAVLLDFWSSCIANLFWLKSFYKLKCLIRLDAILCCSFRRWQIHRAHLQGILDSSFNLVHLNKDSGESWQSHQGSWRSSQLSSNSATISSRTLPHQTALTGYVRSAISLKKPFMAARKDALKWCTAQMTQVSLDGCTRYWGMRWRLNERVAERMFLYCISWSWESSHTLLTCLQTVIMMQVLSIRFRILHAKSMRSLSDSNRRASHDDVPCELVPLMRGAWVGKPSSNYQQKRRFFQLSTDGSTLRWAWNKYVLLYYVTVWTSHKHQLLHVAQGETQPLRIGVLNWIAKRVWDSSDWHGSCAFTVSSHTVVPLLRMGTQRMSTRESLA